MNLFAPNGQGRGLNQRLLITEMAAFPPLNGKDKEMRLFKFSFTGNDYVIGKTGPRGLTVVDVSVAPARFFPQNRMGYIGFSAYGVAGMSAFVKDNAANMFAQEVPTLEQHLIQKAVSKMAEEGISAVQPKQAFVKKVLDALSESARLLIFQMKERWRTTTALPPG